MRGRNRSRDNNSYGRRNISKGTVRIPLILAATFYVIAAALYLKTRNLFYIFNFGYLGSALGIGLFLNLSIPKDKSLMGRRIAQLLIGIYMVGYLGLLKSENMQIEGFVAYLLAGIFAGATLHYFIAKIAGPLIFGRGWCGWACWTAMVLDFLPWKKPQSGRIKKLESLRYIHLAVSVSIVLYFWFILGKGKFLLEPKTAFLWLIIGNAFYYISGIILAAVLKDNRAFCKYLCPVSLIMKIPSRFSLLKIEIDKEKCRDCKLCEINCPMDIKLLTYKNKGERILSSECILCTTCIKVCPFDAIGVTFRPDGKIKNEEYLNYKG
ncbi:MAG: 4Fe-4S dicluster domain-containing protein [Caldisericaceae bacterium]|nr:4Fe-4S dicluster domain-containing protein [Caldisericaceae bacterium]